MDCRQIAAPGTTRCRHCGGQILLADESALLGTLLGRYALSEVIGVGGMGIVFAAEHLGLRRQVALKLLLPELGHTDFLERFSREAQMLAELRHPNIVEIFDFDITEFGVPYYVMERLDGIPLSLAQLRHGRPLTPTQLAPIIDPVALALDYAHARGVVHRDLKPENIFLAREHGALHAKLLDFGIAKKLGAEPIHERLTVTGTVMGTPLYLTPEQLTGETVVAATDQYALALIVAELLSGRPVRQGQSITQILRQSMLQALPDELLGDALSAPVRAALQRATAADPGERFDSVGAFVAALQIEAAADAHSWLADIGFFSAAPMITSSGAQTIAQPIAYAGTGSRPSNLAAVRPRDDGQPTEALLHADTQRSRLRSRRSTAYFVAAVVAIAIAITTWSWMHARLPASTTASATPMVALSEDLRLSTPVDAGALIGLTSAGAVMATAGGVYVQAIAADAKASRRVVGGEQVIATDDQGMLLIQRGATLFLSDPKGQGEDRLFDPPATARLLTPARDGHVIAYVDGDAVHWRDADGNDQIIAQYRGRNVQHIRLGERSALLLLQQPDEAQLIDLRSHALLWSAPTRVGLLFDVAWQEDAAQLALCGFSQQVEIFDLSERTAVPQLLDVDTACYAAQWLAEGPTLVVRANHELVVRNSQGVTHTDWPIPAGAVGSTLPRFHLNHDTLLLSEPERNLLLRFSLGGFHPQPISQRALGEPWDLQVIGDAVLIASADGVLWRVDDHGARDLRVHDNGITDIVAGSTHFATASDDRTLAVWRNADLSVTWRARGHEFLINQMWLAPDESALWSSSSDGSLKRWNWPQLELQESIDLRRLLNQPKLALHGLWFSADQQQALVGSWQHQIVHLRKRDGQWQASAHAMTSSAGYRMLGLSSVNAVVILGIEPSRLYLWDLGSGSLQTMPDYGLSLLALCEGSSDQQVFAAGEGQMIELQVRRDASAKLVVSGNVRNLQDVGVVGAAAVDRAKQSWVLGSGDGRLYRVPWRALTP